MRIGIDCRRILDINHGENAGVGHYVYYLIKNLLKIDKENEYYLFLYDHKIKVNEFQQENVKIIYFPGLENIGKIPFFYRHWFLPHVLKLYKLDVYHNPANIIPLCYFRKSVITIHDLAIYKNADWFPDHQYFTKSVTIPFSIRKAKKIIAVSESTKNDLIKFFKVKPGKIEVIYEGVEDFNQLVIDETKIKPELKVAKPYFLYLGTLEPRKNLVRLIEAFNEFQKENKDFKLILAGKTGWKYEPIFETISRLKLQNKVISVGYINKEEKIYLLRNSFAFVFPSLYEGFGLPILEAMNLGVPIVTSNIASIPELVIDNAVLADPYSVGSIRDALFRITKDNQLREKLTKKGRGIAQNFTWENCAKKTIEVYKSIK
ncbi:MAG: glycosyltransferase family 1 protein [Patescibacteria group bacterium]|nr:glycosyltransferase family 1 protein [Patescibacteria group bacterium]